MASALSSASSFTIGGTRLRKLSTRSARISARQSRQVVRAELETQVVVTAVNATCLALGRWAFMPLMRANAEKAGPPMQNGVSHYDAGDTRAQEASFITSTNDPAGFTLVDTLLWGSVGHALAFIVLATNASLRVG